MFVVMARTATEADVLGVKSRILAEGMTPFDHHRAEHIVIAGFPASSRSRRSAARSS
jgi:hypothetical protein